MNHSRFIGAAYAQLGRVYRLVRLHVNFFQPARKLAGKTRDGARERRRNDRAQAPYQRLCASGALDPARREELEGAYRSLNPLRLRRQIDTQLEKLWALAARTINEPERDWVTETSEVLARPGNTYS